MAISKILLVAGSANFSTRDVWDGYRVALEEIGIDVVPYPTFSFLKVLSAESVGSDIIGHALDIERGIDCVVFIDGLYFRGKRKKIPQSIRAAGIPTVLIATDDPYEEIANAESLYTYHFTNETNCASDTIAYLPTATLPVPSIPRNESPSYDVSFLGTVFEDRIGLLTEIADYCEREQKRFLIAGKFPAGMGAFENRTFTDVRRGTIDSGQKWEIYWDSKITINEFRESEQPAASPSPRVFEVTALGQAALLSGPERSEVTKIYGDTIYRFEDAKSAITSIESALSNETERVNKIEKAQEITTASHLYQHRGEQLIACLRDSEQQRSIHQSSEEKIAWVIGCGRTGSTWLSEMLADIPKIRRWHEPYFGRFFKHVSERPDELKRSASFFFDRHQSVLAEGMRELFFRMVHERYPQFGRHSLVVKEVNTPEVYPWLRTLFPAGRLIHLIRDPFDTFDSYLDLQKPGSWNDRFGESDGKLTEQGIRRTAQHIADCTTASLQAYETFPQTQRLEVRYEDLIESPIDGLKQCGHLISVDVTQDDAQYSSDKHAFQNYEKTGSLQFRRKGRAGVWQESENFTPQVAQIANEILGPLRARLGYGMETEVEAN